MTVPTMGDGYRTRLNRLDATPLLLAAKGAYPEMMELLLEHGAGLRAKTAEGTTALMLAAGVAIFNEGDDAGTEEETLRAVKLLVERGADCQRGRRQRRDRPPRRRIPRPQLCRAVPGGLGRCARRQEQGRVDAAASSPTACSTRNSSRCTATPPRCCASLMKERGLPVEDSRHRKPGPRIHAQTGVPHDDSPCTDHERVTPCTLGLCSPPALPGRPARSRRRLRTSRATSPVGRSRR